MNMILVLKRYCLLFILLIAFTACDDEEGTPTSDTSSPDQPTVPKEPRALTQEEIAELLEGTTDFEYVLTFSALPYTLKAMGSGSLVRTATGDTLNMSVKLDNVDILKNFDTRFSKDTYTLNYDIVNLKAQKHADNSYTLSAFTTVDDEGHTPTLSSEKIKQVLSQSADFELQSFKATVKSNGLDIKSTFVISQALAARILTPAPSGDLSVTATLKLTYQKKT